MSVDNALQVLEHTQLVLLGFRGASEYTLEYALTRAGHDALERGDVLQRLRGTSS